MLPYGTLWKLDQMLHPVAPPQRRTVAMRRRQALFYFIWGVLLVSIFLLPFHYASLRRLRMDGARRVRGASAPEMDVAELEVRQDRALKRLTTQMAAPHDAATAGLDADTTASATSADFELLFYYHPKTEVRLRGMFDHPLLRGLAGAGSGKLWKRLGDEVVTGLEQDELVTTQRRTIAQVAVSAQPAGRAAGQAACLASLRRDYIESRLGSAVGADTEPLHALRKTIEHFDTLDPIGVSMRQSAAPLKDDDGAPTEIMLARLFLWIANDATLADDALSRAVAGCSAPLSRSLHVSFDRQALRSNGPSHSKLFAAAQEAEEALMQYVCLCSGKGPAHAVFLENAAGAEVAASTLFLVDPRRVVDAKMATCADTCGRVETA